MDNSSKLKQQILELRRQGLKYREIKTLLGCTLSVISYHCKNAGLTSDNSFRKLTESNVKSWQQLYDSGLSLKEVGLKIGRSVASLRLHIETRQKKTSLTAQQKKERNVIAVLKRRRKVKKLLVDYKGGKCEICGYNKCLRALQFHHTDPQQKEYKISNVSNSFETLKKEVDKCMLVCSNCHAEIEEELFLNRGL